MPYTTRNRTLILSLWTRKTVTRPEARARGSYGKLGVSKDSYILYFQPTGRSWESSSGWLMRKCLPVFLFSVPPMLSCLSLACLAAVLCCVVCCLVCCLVLSGVVLLFCFLSFGCIVLRLCSVVFVLTCVIWSCLAFVLFWPLPCRVYCLSSHVWSRLALSYFEWMKCCSSNENVLKHLCHRYVWNSTVIEARHEDHPLWASVCRHIRWQMVSSLSRVCLVFVLCLCLAFVLFCLLVSSWWSSRGVLSSVGFVFSHEDSRARRCYWNSILLN